MVLLWVRECTVLVVLVESVCCGIAVCKGVYCRGGEGGGGGQCAVILLWVREFTVVVG